MKTNILLIPIITILLNFILLQNSYCQLSKIEIDKERTLYKNNKVKSVIITGNKGFKNITEIDREGKKIKSNDYYNNQEANITNYEYDLNGNLTEESYYGYESGDGISHKYYYDENGNLIGDEEEWGGDESNGPENQYYYDVSGNVYRMIKYGREISYDNIYEDGKLISASEICKEDDSMVYVIKYTYESDLLNSIEKYEKNCNDGTLKFSSRETYTYFPNMLVKQTSSEYDYDKSVEIKKYDYEYFR